MINKLKTARSLFLGRAYHSVQGVYGYRPPIQKPAYKVPEKAKLARNSQSNVFRWIEAYRKHGHKLASVNPISQNCRHVNILELKPEFYGLQAQDIVELDGLCKANSTVKTVSDLESLLQEMYSGLTVSAEFSYIEDLEEREWLSENFEKLHAQGKNDLDNNTRQEIAKLMIQAQVWEKFMGLKFPTVKRYSGEGAEGLLAFFRSLLIDAVEAKLEHIVIAMPHRGRTALQTVLFNMRPAKVFRKLQGHSEFPDNILAMSDVISHFHTSEDLDVRGKKIHVSMVRNSSHLEAANPVSMGKTRSKQQTLRDGAYSQNNADQSFETRILNVIIHGDAAFPGQGVNQECLNMAYVPHFEIGGTVHLVVNNQVGFTTPNERGRSTLYCTDLAKTIQSPVFHVNGNDPDMIALTTRLALDYQQRFHKDVFIDMNCFRRWGHNELDDPTFTNPSIYKTIHNHKSVPDLYAHQLLEQNLLSQTKIEQIHAEYIDFLTKELDLTNSYQPEPSYYEQQWESISPANDCISYWDTGLDYQLLNYIGHKSVDYPKDFVVHPHLLRTHIEARRRKLTAGEKIDWSTAEALAIGSLMYQGHNVRLSGEDVGRGTFSHRHAMLVDQTKDEMLIPLNEMAGGLGGRLEIAHSILSEEAVLAFEYGMAIDNPNNLIIWEAQFGDFANGAQIIIDSFIATSETKWMNAHGLVMLLPHGYDGAASEHSSCRIERFLQLCDSKENAPDSDNVNMHIVNPTTPAQYYHVLRRQLLRNFRKPLVVVAPKTLLRLSAATSTHVDFQEGTFFNHVLADSYIVNTDQVTNVIFCSGKHFYSLNEERLSRNLHNTAILRLESLCPFPLHELQTELRKYPNAKNFIWSQEEHRNQGAWCFVRPRFEFLLGKQLFYCGRAEAPTTATGIGNVHKREAAHVITAPFEVLS